jgi:hypothetical protein
MSNVLQHNVLQNATVVTELAGRIRR